MGKQGFEMASQVRTADDILWTKFLLLLPKLLYSRRNNHSNDCANIEMGDNWREVLFKTKFEIIKNKLTSIRSLKFKKMHEANTKKGKYIIQSRFRGFCDLSLEWTYMLHVNVFYNLNTWPPTDQSFQTTEWLELEISLIVKQIERAYTIQTIICRRGTAKWYQSDS